MAVVKANAYGHGLVPTALALSDADSFAVARLEEGIALRAAGVRIPIVLLEGVVNAEQLAEAAHHGFELVVHDPSHLALFEQYRGAERNVLWIKVDTGMNRLGFRPEAFAEAHRRLAALQPAPLEIRVLTHLACADERDSTKTLAQVERFRELVRVLPSNGRPVATSIGNSAGTLGWPEARGTWVRPGLALYGVSPFAGESGSKFGLRPAMTLESTVIAVRDVLVGETVGYVAIVACGYGDGLPRSLPSGAEVLVAGARVSLVGRVSMDMIAVDITEHHHISVGDKAILWGHKLPVEDVAARAGTIPYELLCAVSQRVPIELV
jgi:alanine racemase